MVGVLEVVVVVVVVCGEIFELGFFVVLEEEINLVIFFLNVLLVIVGWICVYGRVWVDGCYVSV